MRSGATEARAAAESGIHPVAARGFQGGLYERGRPGYPPQAVGALDITPKTRVAELGCGTGKLTRSLHRSGAPVIAIDPLLSMLATFRSILSDVPAVAGTAEAIPCRDASFDRVVCASAFHWFRYEEALAEIHRVLRPGGRLGLVWNRRDELKGWAAGFWEITESFRGDTPGYRSGAWRQAIDGSSLFGPVTEHWFDHHQRTDMEGLLARVASISFIDALPASERQNVLERAREFVERHPDTRGREVFEVPYRTAVYVTERVNGS